MDENTIESSFCFKYLINFSGLKRQTIESLVANDYDNIHSLMSFDLDLDLNQLPNVSMGQKSILRDALIKLKKEFGTWNAIGSDLKTPVNHNVLNSTPIAKTKAYSFVTGDQLFKDLITSAMIDITGGPHALPFQSNANHSAKEPDSGINGTDSEGYKTPIKRVVSLSKASKKSSESLEKTENSKRNKSFDKSDNKTKSKKKRKKFCYGLKSARNRKTIESIDKPLFEKSNCERKVFIDIDNSSRIEEQNEAIIPEIIERKNL